VSFLVCEWDQQNRYLCNSMMNTKITNPFLKQSDKQITSDKALKCLETMSSSSRLEVLLISN